MFLFTLFLFVCLFFFSFWRVNWFCLGDSRVAQVNNSPRANVFSSQQGRQERSPQDTPDGFDLYSAQSSFAWPRVDFGLCWIRFSSWESFIGFYIWCYPISTILACLFTVGVRISWKSCVRNGAWRPRCHLVPPTLCIILYGGWIWASYHENSFEHLGQQQLTAEPVEPPWSTMKHPPLSIKWLQPSQQEFSHCCHLY